MQAAPLCFPAESMAPLLVALTQPVIYFMPFFLFNDLISTDNPFLPARVSPP